jgi:hypothetical protein
MGYWPHLDHGQLPRPPGVPALANALIPSCLSDDDRLDFSTRTPGEQAGQTDNPAVGLGHPGSRPLRLGEVVIESGSRVVSTGRGVPVDTSVVPRQLCPQGPAKISLTDFAAAAMDSGQSADHK